MEMSLIIPAFIAGLLTFLAPCTLPLVPGYLGFISGVSLRDINDPSESARARFRIFLNGLLFVLGFSAVFIVLGLTAGTAGSLLIQYRGILGRVGGVFVIIFGLFMVGVVKIPLFNREFSIKVPSLFRRGKPVNSFILGSAFGIGWTPCVGPILGSVLFLAARSGTALQGAFLLSIFSLGLAIPFLLIALGIGHAAQYVHKISKYLNIVSIIGGVFLIFLGALMLTDNMAFFVGQAYQWLQFINYERLYDYL